MMNIIVVGSGLAGATFCVAMQDQPVKITLLEKTLPDALTASQDERPISLSFSTVIALKNLRVWENLRAYACPIKTVFVSEQGVLGSLALKAAEFEWEALGYVVPFFQLHRELYAVLARSDQVEIKTVHDILAIDESDKTIRMTVQTMQGEQKIEAELLVAADGVQSRCRDLLNINTKKTERNDVAVVAILEFDQPHQCNAFERFTHQGVFALLPMWNPCQYRLVWTTDKKNSVSLSDVNLSDTLEKIFSSQLGRLCKMTRLGQYSLQTTIAEQQITRNSVLLGDSAHHIYPLAAQGYNLTVRDVAALAEHYEDLPAYIKMRAQDQRFICCFTQSLETIFGIHIPLLNHLRATGLFAMDLLPPLKKRFMRKLLGQSGRQPKLLCQE